MPAVRKALRHKARQISPQLDWTSLKHKASLPEKIRVHRTPGKDGKGRLFNHSRNRGSTPPRSRPPHAIASATGARWEDAPQPMRKCAATGLEQRRRVTAMRKAFGNFVGPCANPRHFHVELVGNCEGLRRAMVGHRLDDPAHAGAPATTRTPMRSPWPGCWPGADCWTGNAGCSGRPSPGC